MEQELKNYLALHKWSAVRHILFNGAAVAFILIAPGLAHLFSFPLWYLEPMRLVLVLAMVHTSKQNGYLLALVLPLCSWIFSGHPELIKMLIITMELVANAALFYWLNHRLNKPFAAMLTAIFTSKIMCYLMYWGVFSAAFLKAETGMAFIMVQVVVTFFFSLYTAIVIKR